MAQQNMSVSNSTASTERRKNYAVLVLLMRIITGIEIPVMILTLIALCFIIKSRPAASVFIGNLIISDLIQVICLLELTVVSIPYPSPAGVYSIAVGVYFMACVAIERYLLVSHPIWYKSHQSLKLSCFISVIIWFLPLIFVLLIFIVISPLPVFIAFLIPYTIIILCFVGTWRGLSRAISLTALKRKLILGSLFLVLLTYTFLILPYMIMALIMWYFPKLAETLFFHNITDYVALLLFMNPLADCVLYLFIRPDVRNMMKSVRCCCRKHSQDEPSRNCRSAVVCSVSAQESTSISLNTCSSV